MYTYINIHIIYVYIFLYSVCVCVCTGNQYSYMCHVSPREGTARTHSYMSSVRHPVPTCEVALPTPSLKATAPCAEHRYSAIGPRSLTSYTCQSMTTMAALERWRLERVTDALVNRVLLQWASLNQDVTGSHSRQSQLCWYKAPHSDVMYYARMRCVTLRENNLGCARLQCHGRDYGTHQHEHTVW